MQIIEISPKNVVMFVGVSGSGKTTLSRQLGKGVAISSDWCRELVSDDESDQTATKWAFEVLYKIVEGRMAMGRRVAVDATFLKKKDRKVLIDLARNKGYGVHALVVNTPLDVCLQRNAIRENPRPVEVLLRQREQFEMTLKELLQGHQEEGITRLDVIEDTENVQLKWIDPIVKDEYPGPFDIIGDVHGCYEELVQLLDRLGYRVLEDGSFGHPDGRTLVFVGDLVDRGPDSGQVLKLAIDMLERGRALWARGNHDDKMIRALKGNPVEIGPDLQKTLDQIEALDEYALKDRLLKAWNEGKIPHHLVLDGGKLVVAHAGIKEDMIGDDSKRTQQFCLYGDVDQEALKAGVLIRRNWAKDYHGKALVVYGHTVVDDPERINNTINIDTGAAFGGSLTAYRYPEDQLVSVISKRQYADRYAVVRPLSKRAV